MKSGFGGWRGLGIALAALAAGCNALLGNDPSSTDDHIFDEAGAAEASATDASAGADTSQASDACPMGLAACASGCSDVKTDLANCGQCGSRCGGSCVDSECVPIVLATGLSVPQSIGVDGTYVYWTDKGTGVGAAANGNISKVPLDGGAIAPVVSPSDQPNALAIDATGATQVFYSTAGHNVYSVSGAGGTVVPFNTSGLADTVALAFNATTLFGVDQSHIWLEARTGTPSPTTDGTGSLAVALAVDGPDIFVSEKGTCTGAMDGVIEKGAIANLSSSEPWISALDCPWGIAVGNLYVYFTTRGTAGDGAIMKALRTGNTAGPIVTNVSSPTAIALDPSSVFWIEDGASGSISAANLDGSNHRVLATKQVHPIAIAVDATNVYWLTLGTTAGNGSVNRMAKD